MAAPQAIIANPAHPAASRCYPLPPMPDGMTDALRDLVCDYIAGFHGAAEESPGEGTRAALAIAEYPARCRGDLIAKQIIAMHESFPLWANEWMAVDGFPTDAARELAFGVLNDLQELPCQIEWQRRLKAYMTARIAQDTYDAEHFDAVLDGVPVGPTRNALCDSIPREIWDHASKLSDARGDAEDALMACPSPDLAAFVIKVRVARGDDRNLDGWDEMLLEEAARFGCPL